MADPFIVDAPPAAAPRYTGAGFVVDLEERRAPNPRRAKDIGDALIVGLQDSATGLALRGKMPAQQLEEDAPWYHRLARNVGSVAADLPLSIAAAVPGFMAGGPIGAGATSFAAPMALREALVEAYNYDHAVSWADAWELGKTAAKAGVKGAVIGAATMGAGKAVAPVLAGSGKVATAVGTTGAELAALTATSAAVEQHMPSWQDFMDNAILLGGLKGAVGAAKGLRNIYAETGKLPAEVLADAATFPKLKEALAAGKGEVPEMYKPVALEQQIKAAIDAEPRPEMIRKMLAGDPTPPKLGEAPIADPVKYEYVNNTDAAKGVLRAVTEMYQQEMTTQTRGVVTNKATAIEGLQTIASGKIAEHIVGDAANAAEIYARAHMLRGATNHAVAELQKLAAIPEAELTPAAKLQALAALERVAMLKAEVEGVGAEAGRALQIFRTIKRDPSFLGDAEMLLAVAERKGRLQDIAALAGSLRDPAQMAQFARDYAKATTTEKVVEAWKAAILSGPQTHLANIMGNTLKWAVDVPESVLSASFTALERFAKGDPLTLSQYKARALAPIYGLQLGSMDALKVAAEVWKQKGDLLEKADVYRPAIEGKTGDVVRLPFRVLQVEDALFRTLAERAEAHIMAVDRAAKEGWHPGTAEGRAQIMRYVQEPGFGLTEAAALKAMERVQQAGAEAVFAQRLGPFLETLQGGMARHAPVLQFVVPFVRTPANLVSWAIQHTPLLNVLSGRWRADWAAGGERQAKAVARVVIGTGLAMTAYTLAQDGLLTGGGISDKELSRTKGAAGIQPYSIKVGDKWYSYQRMEPIAKVMGIAADLVELTNSKKLDEGDRAKAMSMLVLLFGNATISTTYLSGLSNLMQSITDPERYGENFLEQYASSIVPKIIGQSTMLADPYKREVDGVLDAIQSQLPFLREKLLPKRDAWGEPAANNRWFAVLPVATSAQSEERVRTEAVRLQIAMADAPRFLMESGPFTVREKRVKLEPEQRDIYREVSGKNAMAILAPIVNAPDWDRIPDFAKGMIYKDVIEGTRKQGAYSALPPDAAERQKVREKILQKIIQQSQDVSGK